MHTGQLVLLVFGVFILFGGVMGYRAGSKASLIAGSASGALLIAAFLLSYSNLVAGLWVGTVVGLVLCVTTGMRLAKTGKFMPSGMLLAVSVIATAALAFLANRGG